MARIPPAEGLSSADGRTARMVMWPSPLSQILATFWPHRPAPPKRQAWRLLRQRDFRLYFVGSLVSNVGTWFQNTAQVLLTYQLTRSVFAVGVVTCAQFSSSLLLGPTAAVVASRIGGKRLLIGTQVASAVIAGGLAGLRASGLLDEPLLIVGALLLGLLFTFALPVQTALVPRLVQKQDTEAAAAMNSVSYNAGRALAPALCVAVIIGIGYTWAFAFNAVSFVAFGWTLARTHLFAQPKPAEPPRLRDSFTVAVRYPRILLILAMVAAITLADDPILILGPALARHVGIGSDGAGYFLTALGFGTVLGSLWPTRDMAGLGRSRASQRAAAPLVVLAIAMGAFGWGFPAALCVLAAVLAGVAALRAGVAALAQLIRMKPAQLGSVMALWAIAWAGTKPIASVVDGSLASALGIRWACLVLALPAFVLGVGELRFPKKLKQRIKNASRGWAGTPPSPREMTGTEPVASGRSFAKR